ncbi:hypothetical protein C1646_819341 [Rhizophagus diaphanus]|nr:hypothetical protein C1646_819341 [Rhizophagus diaphanus] [Rhizophagus sp. MUCL 43196]
MIKHAFQLQKLLDETIRIELELEGYSISSNEWQTLKELCHVFYKATKEISIKKEYEKLQIYYSKTDESIIYPIATILDLRIKLKYYKQQKWEEDYINKSF